jgi:hypothetical protein
MLAAAPAHADTTLLNVSCDPTREFAGREGRREALPPLLNEGRIEHVGPPPS